MVLELNSRALLKGRRLTGNDRKVLKILLKNSRKSDVEIGKKINVSAQAAYKIRKKLEEFGVIKDYSAEVDYSQVGIEALALVRLEIKETKLGESEELMQFMSDSLLNLSKLFVSSGSYLALFGFEDMQKLYNFFNEVQSRYSPIVSIEKMYTLHVDGLFKNSAKDLFNKAIAELGRETFPKFPKLGYYSFDKKKAEKKGLSKNEKKVLKLFLKNGRGFYNQFSEEEGAGLTGRGISKIKERLEERGVIKNYSVSLDYSSLGINVFAFVFLKKKPQYWGLKEGLCRWAETAPNIIECYRLNEDSLHALFCGFRSLEELETYWKNFEKLYGDLIEIKKIYITSKRDDLSNRLNICEGVLGGK